MKIITHSAEETVAVGIKIGKLLRSGDVIAFSGGLGAGKTTITRGLVLGTGLPDETSSPTFSIVNEYAGNGTVFYHFDMYRISGVSDLETTGFYDYLESGGIIAVEWSENISDELPEGAIYINIRSLGGDAREITVTGDERFEAFSD